MDNITNLKPEFGPVAGTPDPDVIAGLEVLLEQAKRGQIGAIHGVGINQNGEPFSYAMGNPRTGIPMLGQLQMCVFELSMMCKNAQRMMWKPPVKTP